MSTRKACHQPQCIIDSNEKLMKQGTAHTPCWSSLRQARCPPCTSAWSGVCSTTPASVTRLPRSAAAAFPAHPQAMLDLGTNFLDCLHMYSRCLILFAGACCTVIRMPQAACCHHCNFLRADQVCSLWPVSAEDGAEGSYLLLSMGRWKACRACLTGWK